jgi:hypothetical protein
MVCAHTPTRTGGHGTKPIEVYSHDTARYVADMLAHMHQALATEYDLLVNVLLKKCDAAGMRARVWFAQSGGDHSFERTHIYGHGANNGRIVSTIQDARRAIAVGREWSSRAVSIEQCVHVL